MVSACYVRQMPLVIPASMDDILWLVHAKCGLLVISSQYMCYAVNLYHAIRPIFVKYHLKLQL